MMFDKNSLKLITEISQKLREKKLKITCAESCSGGLLSALFTEISGSSDIFDRGFVTYSNEAKEQMLGVKKTTLKKFGAVSFEIAKEMAYGALKNSAADIAIAITGIAGPKSDNTKKPVGLVYIAFAQKKSKKLLLKEFNFKGGRAGVRKQTVKAAILLLSDFLV